MLTKQTFWVFVAAVIAFIYLSFATTAFFTPDNLFNVFRNFAFTGIMGLGMTAVIITGGIDLSVGSVLASPAWSPACRWRRRPRSGWRFRRGCSRRRAGGVSGYFAYIGMAPSS
jgi:hypothetical protein